MATTSDNGFYISFQKCMINDYAHLKLSYCENHNVCANTEVTIYNAYYDSKFLHKLSDEIKALVFKAEEEWLSLKDK